MSEESTDRPFVFSVVEDDGENTGQGGERDISEKRRGQQHEQQQEDRVQHAGDRRAPARADVGGGAGDRAGGVAALP